jgi:hypothetical protein
MEGFLETHLHKEVLRSAVSRQIFDRVSGEVLDVRRVVLVEVMPDTPESVMDVMPVGRYVSWFLPLTRTMAEGVRVEIWYGPALFDIAEGDGHFFLEAGDEPYCNHDAVAVTGGRCECGAVVVSPDQGTLL